MRHWVWGFLLVTVVFTGCSHREKIRAVEGGIETPYDSLGTLEVHVSTNPWKPSNWGWSLKEILTLSFADTSYEKRLQKSLVKKAKKHRDVDQIINVQYWPAPDSKVFPHAQIRARGEMIHYKRFAQPPVQPAIEG